MRPLELLEITLGIKVSRLLAFLHFEIGRWEPALGDDDVEFVQKALLHWNNLDTGKRLRRAAHRYAQAVGDRDVVDAYQSAYMGLEALEKPLAIEFGIEPGVEEVHGKCDHCGVEYVRKRTALAGVRRYIAGDAHDAENTGRAEDWKKLSRLRTDLVHGLADMADVEAKASDLLPAVCHYLHDASAHLAHAHELEVDGFRMIRAAPLRLVLLVELDDPKIPALELCQQLFESRPAKWVSDPEHGVVPELAINNRSGARDARGRHFFLHAPLSHAKETDLEPARFKVPT